MTSPETSASKTEPADSPGSPAGSETYHGTHVPTPFAWLEDLDSERTTTWAREQSARTLAYLEAIPERDAIRARLNALWNFERYSAPAQRGPWYIQTRNSGLQNQDVLIKRTALDAEPTVLLDPNTLSQDGTTALMECAFTPDGRLLAYQTSRGGSDWREVHIRNVATGEDLEDVVSSVKFSDPTWTHDGAGFLYSRYPAPSDDPLADVNQNQSLCYHKLGTSQDEDVVVCSRPDEPTWGYRPEITADGRYIVVHVWKGSSERNRIHVIDLGDPQQPDLRTPVLELVAEFEAEFVYIGQNGRALLFRTTLDAPQGKVIAIDLDTPQRGAWRTIISESPDHILDDVELADGRLVVTSFRDVVSMLRTFTLDGTEVGRIDLPGMGTILALYARHDSREIFIAFESYLFPPRVYRVDAESCELELLWAPSLDFDSEGYVTEQLFYASKDGTRVPMFVTHRRGLELSGDQPTLMWGYGGFNQAMTPACRLEFLVWLEMGGMVAVPNLRGGGEYGRAWHMAGTLERKQNVFDDCIAGAEELIERGYTRKEKLAIMGRSNGGLLVGAVMTQRPDLFAAVVPAVGVMDMLRYHRFTIGWAWASDYGTADDPEHFRFLRAYSPLHNLRAGTEYPATLVITADHDDRVVPSHSFKFAAALQEAQAGPAPTLIRVSSKAGHGQGTSTAKLIDERADTLAFLARNLALEGVEHRLGDTIRENTAG